MVVDAGIIAPCILASAEEKYNNNTGTKESNMRKKQKRNETVPLYAMLASAGGKKRSRKTGATAPDEQSVIDAKNWADENEK